MRIGRQRSGKRETGDEGDGSSRERQDQGMGFCVRHIRITESSTNENDTQSYSDDSTRALTV